MKMIQYVVTLCVLGSLTLYAEPSVYGNSSFTSPQTGIHNNQKSIAQLTRKLANQSEQIAGLKSIIEGLSATVHELQQSVQSGVSSNGRDTNLLHDLAGMIDKINSTYISKEALEERLSRQTVTQVEAPIVTKEPEVEVTENTTEQTAAKTYSEGVRLFVKHRYDEAKKRFVDTDKRGYKAAASNYYLGEMAYYSKAYEDAIFYYKKSAGLDDKASYIDTLLLHTAIALEKGGKKDQAKVFYENIIANYSGKKTAQIAKEKLEKL